MGRFIRCNREFCDYDSYYVNQAKNRYDNVIPYQRGANWFTSFAKRYAVPAIKYLGKQTYKYGKDFIKDLALGEEVKSAAKTHLKRGASGLLDDLSQKILNSAKKQTETQIPSLTDHLEQLQSEGRLSERKLKGIKTLFQKGSGKRGYKRKRKSQKRNSTKKKVKRNTSNKKIKKDIFV